MENERKGNGIFLGIVGVATLIVAIIGASFAYFSAQAASAESAVDLTAYEFNATLSMQEVYASTAGLIPVAPTGTIENATAPNNTNLMYALNVKKSCEDEHDLRICALYQVTVTNGGAASITLDGSIVTTANTASSRTTGTTPTPFANLQYREVTFDEEDSETPYTVGSTAVPLATTVGESAAIGSITVPANSSVTKYVLIYLNENGDQSAEMGASFEGQIAFASSEGANTNRLTGTFTVAAGGGN